MAVTNQKIIKIIKPRSKNKFLMIGIEDWQDAYKNLTPASFGMYLYFASNANEFELELSKVAVENAIGIKKSAYYKSLTELEAKGYLVQDDEDDNYYSFFPQLRKENSTNEELNKTHSTNEELNSTNEELNSTNEELNSTSEELNSTSEDETVHKSDIQIKYTDNTYNTNTKNNTYSQSEFSQEESRKDFQKKWGVLK